MTERLHDRKHCDRLCSGHTDYEEVEALRADLLLAEENLEEQVELTLKKDAELSVLRDRCAGLESELSALREYTKQLESQNEALTFKEDESKDLSNMNWHRLKNENTRLEGALRSLVDKLDECGPHVSGAFQMAYLSRGRDYTGPTYGEEHEAARAALAGSHAPAEGSISGGVSFKDGAWTYASKEPAEECEHEWNRSLPMIPGRLGCSKCPATKPRDANRKPRASEEAGDE